MTSPILRRPLTAQPQGVAKLNTQALRAADIAVAWSGVGIHEVVKGAAANAVLATATPAISRVGRGRTLDASGTLRWTSPLPGSTTSHQVTFGIIYTPDAAAIAATDQRLGGVAQPAADQGFCIWLDSGFVGYVVPGVTATQIVTTALTAGVPYFIGLSYNDATTEMNFLVRDLRSGLSYAVLTSLAANRWLTGASPLDFFIGSEFNGAGNGATGTYSFASMHMSALTVPELAAFAANPWQIFKVPGMQPWAALPTVPYSPIEDAWDWSDDSDDFNQSIPIYDMQIGADAAPPVTIGLELDWSWDEDTGDEMVHLVDKEVGANQPAIAVPDEWIWDEGTDEPIDESMPVAEVLLLESPIPESIDFSEDVGDEQLDDASEPVGDNEPPVAALDAWGWDDDAIDEDSPWFEFLNQDFTAPVDIVLDTLPDFAEDTGDESIDESGPVSADAPTSVDVVLQDEPELAQDAGDELLEDSGPVGDNEPSIAAPEAWSADEDSGDELIEDSGPVGDNEPAIAALDAWPWDDDAVDEPIEPSAALVIDPVIIVDQPPADAWDWPDDGIEEPADDSAPVGLDEPPLTVADAWHWDEEPADDDTHWQLYEQALVDFVQLPGPTYAEAWDWNGEDTDDDAQFLEPTQPDASAVGPPPPDGPTNAELLAMIQDLQRQLDEMAKRIGTGGGGGDGFDERRHIIDRAHDTKRARIEANNELIMALVGAMTRRRSKPKDEPK